MGIWMDGKTWRLQTERVCRSGASFVVSHRRFESPGRGSDQVVEWGCSHGTGGKGAQHVK